MKKGITRKLIGSFLLGISLFAVSMGMVYFIIEDLVVTIREVKTISRRLELTGDLQFNLNKLHTPVTNYLITGDINERTQFDKQITRISAILEELKENKAGRRWEEVLKKVTDESVTLGEMAVELLYIEKPVGNKKVSTMIMDMNALTDRVVGEAKEFHSITLDDMRLMGNIAAEKEKKAKATFLTVLVMSIMALPILSIYLSRYVTRPILTLHKGAKAIGDGDLSYRITVKTGDEIEGLADAFNEMAASIEGTDRELKSKKNELEVSLEKVMALNRELQASREELSRKNEEMGAANIKLRELDRLKSEFLANMSHELRTPLTAIIGFSELLIDKMMGPLNNDEQAETLNSILTSGQHLLKLINDILDLSKIEAGKMELRLEKFQLDEIIYFVTSTVAPLIEKKKQTLKVEIAEGMPEIYADPGKIKQLLLNLVGNAIKFTPDSKSIIIGVKLKDTYLVLSVKDAGIGIKPEDRDRIFQGFQQARSSASREYGGTGLGLTLSRRIAEMHGGRIELESEVGKGSTFTAYIPVRFDKSNEPDKEEYKT